MNEIAKDIVRVMTRRICCGWGALLTGICTPDPSSKKNTKEKEKKLSTA